MGKPDFIRTHFYGDGCPTHGQVEDIPATRLAGPTDLSTILGISVSSIKRLAARASETGFPDPAIRTTYQRLWDIREVEAWFDYWRLTRRHRSL